MRQLAVYFGKSYCGSFRSLRSCRGAARQADAAEAPESA